MKPGLEVKTLPRSCSPSCFLVRFADVLRAGGSAQGHLIFHPNSYFPRSARLNLTADILGASINVLETAARFEGFEILIEQMFGKDGYYPDDRIMKLFDLQTPEERDADEKLAWNVRGRRSLSDDINNVEKHLTKLHQKVRARPSLRRNGCFA